MNFKKLILAISGLGVLAMLFVSVNFYIEKNKSTPAAVRQTANSETKVAFQPAENQGQMREQEAPNLPPQTMLPENIPPAMLKAMQEKGLTIEDLQKDSKTNQGMPAMQNMPKGKAFPEEMLKALAAQEQAREQESADPVQKAVSHIKGHSDAASIKYLEENLAALQGNPNNETALAAVAEIFLTHNETEGAETLLQQGIIAAPNNAVFPFLYGQVFAKNSQFDKTAEQWERALSLQDSAELHYSLGMLYRYQLNKDSLAKEHFQKAKALPHQDAKLAEHLSIELEK